MLRSQDNDRTIKENIKLGSLTAFSAGMVNVTSVFIFFAFTSNVTGHYAILAQEISKGNWYEAAVVMGWIFLFFMGNFTSNLLIINTKTRFRHLGHSVPIVLEITCLLVAGLYLDFWYEETLTETEILVALMLFAMGLQNGLTASISNYAVKTTHLTGLTTDLGILFSLFTKKVNRANRVLREKAALLLSIMFSYVIGGVLAGVTFIHLENKVFYVACLVLGGIIIYDYTLFRLNKAFQTSLSLNEQVTGSKAA